MIRSGDGAGDGDGLDPAHPDPDLDLAPDHDDDAHSHLDGTRTIPLRWTQRMVLEAAVQQQRRRRVQVRELHRIELRQLAAFPGTCAEKVFLAEIPPPLGGTCCAWWPRTWIQTWIQQTHWTRTEVLSVAVVFPQVRGWQTRTGDGVEMGMECAIWIEIAIAIAIWTEIAIAIWTEIAIEIWTENADGPL